MHTDRHAYVHTHTHAHVWVNANTPMDTHEPIVKSAIGCKDQFVSMRERESRERV